MADSQSLDFSGRRVLIAGASRGIGRAMVLGFLAAGAAVSACARGAEGLTELANAAGADATRLHTMRCDLGVDADIKAWIEAAAAALGGIDVLINNASGYGFGNDDASWEADFGVDLMAAVRASRHALPWLERSPAAAILNTSSIAASGPRPKTAPYGALKAALNHYTRSQALALARKRIRVNAIAPGSIEFPGGIWGRTRDEKPDEYAKVLASIPFGRYGNPDDIARVALFLASPAAAWITGQIIAVDGGQSLT